MTKRMPWLPRPQNFRGELRDALESVDALDKLARLTALAGTRLDFIETIQVDRALSQITLGDRSVNACRRHRRASCFSPKPACRTALS